MNKNNKIRYDDTKHYPNKGEAAVLRRLMASNGLTEKEVRAVKKYRVVLSEASRKGEKEITDDMTKWYRNKIKAACQKTGLVPQHPDTIKVLDEMLADIRSHCWGYPWYIYQKLDAKAVVLNFAK